MLTFKWFGQACFGISDGKTIVTDPHDGKSVGLKRPGTKGDIITVSHDHYDHASGKMLVSKDDTIVVQGMHSGEADSINLERFQTYHDKVDGDARGRNTIFKFKLDDVSICHLGDLGHTLDQETIREIKPVDILMVPVGGKFTVDGDEAADVVRALEPQVVIPMHYKVEGLEVPIFGPGRFLNNIGDDYEVTEMEVLELDGLPEKRMVYVLDCLA